VGWLLRVHEAADYTAGSQKPVLVRQWMAQHQGLSLLAILNLLHQNVLQQWFHANPEVQANELLLHEMPVSESALSAQEAD
jgi:hypothetical protein